ncbi:MAG: cation:proton antiporter [Kofleriaceae bacterium]
MSAPVIIIPPHLLPDPNATVPISTTESSLFAMKVIVGLIVLVVLAYLGGHRRVVRFQERLGISGVITAGFPFVALGLVAASDQVGILNTDIIERLRPVLQFGLGWIGFIIGAQLDIRVLDRVPKGTAYLILVEALGPFGITIAGCGAVMIAFGQSWRDPFVWRDLILLGTAAAMTAPRKFRGFANRTWHEGRSVDVLLGQLDELVGVLGLLFITAYFRSETEGSWQIPNTAWVFVSLGLGVAIGVVVFAMVRLPKSNAEFLAVVLGGIAFASGIAGHMMLSPIVICFLAGVLVTNFPNDQRENIFKILRHLERPVHMMFLIVAGAVWNVADWRGWALVPLFVACRVVGKYAGVITSRTAVGALLPVGFADNRKLVAPMSGLSVALVISVGSVQADAGLAWVITTVIGGSILTEVLVQLTSKRAPDAEARGPVYRDELDAGPVYIDELDEPDEPEDDKEAAS